jgi:maleate isomerase
VPGLVQPEPVTKPEPVIQPEPASDGIAPTLGGLTGTGGHLMCQDAAMPPRTLLGVLTPSSNTRLEPLTSAMLAATPWVTAHFSRFRVVDVGLRAAAQFDPGPIVESAGLLADAQVDAIVWSGTSGGWRGIADDQALCAAITEATGVPATTSTLALLAALEVLGTRRLGLVTPYPDDMHDAIVATFTGERLEIVASAHDGFTGSNWELSIMPPERIGELVTEVAAAQPGAISVFCTNLAAADRVQAWESALGVPVLDSVALAVWHALELSGYAGPRPTGWGRLFSLRPPPAGTASG